MSVGSRICLVNLQKAELNGLLGDILSVGGERVGVELEQNDQRIAVRPHILEPGREPRHRHRYRSTPR